VLDQAEDYYWLFNKVCQVDFSITVQVIECRTAPFRNFKGTLIQMSKHELICFPESFPLLDVFLSAWYTSMYVFMQLEVSKSVLILQIFLQALMQKINKAWNFFLFLLVYINCTNELHCDFSIHTCSTFNNMSLILPLLPICAPVSRVQLSLTLVFFHSPHILYTTGKGLSEHMIR
jgi:hypothetical protein